MFEKCRQRFRVVKSRLINEYKTSHISFGCYLGPNVTLEGNNWICSKTYIENSSLGFGSYIANDAYLVKTKVGRFTSIGPKCSIVAGNHPTNTFVSTHPAFYSKDVCIGFTYTSKDLYKEFEYADINEKYFVVIGNDVWIASDVIIMAGVTIGDGAVIAAGAIVANDVPPYAVVGGIPAKVIKYRFCAEDINSLLRFCWWNKDEKWIMKHASYFVDMEKFRTLFNDKL